MLMLGEIQTGLLQNSASVPLLLCVEALGLVPGERVRHSERPIGYAVSPDLLTGVDCQLPTNYGAKVRGIGTVISRAMITEGRVLQGSAFTRIRQGRAGRRLSWSYYLSKPGEVETTGRFNPEDIAVGFLTREQEISVLDLGAISGRTMDEVQKSRDLDRRPPFRGARTRLRWVAMQGKGAAGDIQFCVESQTLRTVRIDVPDSAVWDVVELCEDLALHDWLLTTLKIFIERSRMGEGSRSQVVDKLQPAIDHLLHLWMPAARLGEWGASIWERLERQPGFSRQWNTMVHRIRDQMLISAIALLSDALDGIRRS